MSTSNQRHSAPPTTNNGNPSTKHTKQLVFYIHPPENNKNNAAAAAAQDNNLPTAVQLKNSNLPSKTQGRQRHTSQPTTGQPSLKHQGPIMCRVDPTNRHCHTLLKLQQLQQKIQQAKCQLHSKLVDRQRSTQLKADHESLSLKNRLLKEELIIVSDKLLTDQSALDQGRQGHADSERTLEARSTELEQKSKEMKEEQSMHIERRELLVKTNASLSFRRRQLAADLSFIYPILPHSYREDGKVEYAICGVRLPNTEEYMGEDGHMLAVAFGYVCHLLHMIAKFIELPLRYPVKPMGSRSAIMDLDMDKLTENEREFPLYSQGKEKFKFHYGVFLLNKNIAQLRYHVGLGTSDLRATLTNLKSVFEKKFGIRVVSKSSGNSGNTSMRSSFVSNLPTGGSSTPTPYYPKSHSQQSIH